MMSQWKKLVANTSLVQNSFLCVAFFVSFYSDRMLGFIALDFQDIL